MSKLKLRIGLAGKLFLAILLVLLGTTPGLSGKLQEEPGNPKLGRDLFISKGCLRCHSVWKSSEKTKGPNLASVGMGQNLYDLCALVWSHWSRMNEVLEQEKETRILLQPSNFKDIIAYLYYLNYYNEPGDSSIGESIFLKKGCIQCHAIKPLHAETKLGPPAYAMGEFQDAISLAVAVWNHGKDMSQKMAKLGIQWPKFEGEEVAHLVAFIRSSTLPPQRSMVLPGSPARGQALFTAKSCTGCHGTKTGLGPNLASSKATASLSSLVGSLWNHYPKMSQTMAAGGVSYPRITRDEMEDLVAYIYWLRAYGLAGNAAVGRNLFHSKQCASCHCPSSGKPALTKELLGSEATQSVYSLLAAIWNHGPQMESLLREHNISWPKLDGEEMRDLIAFFGKGKDP